jgi:putative ABC transport system permease protein
MRALVALELTNRNLRRHRRRSLIAVLSVAFGITAMVVATGFTEWMFVDFREAMIESQYGHIQISRPGFHENGTADPYRFVLPSATGATAARRRSRLALACPRLMLTGLVSRGDSTVSFTGRGSIPAKSSPTAGRCVFWKASGCSPAPAPRSCSGAVSLRFSAPTRATTSSCS